MIDTHEERYIPVASYFIRRCTPGLFYDLMSSQKRKQIGNVIGKALEDYVRIIVEDTPRHGDMLFEEEYSKGKKSCEWIVNGTEATVIIECKRSGLLQGHKTTGRRSDIKAYLNKGGGLVHGTEQLGNTARLVRAGRITGANPEKRIILLLVTLDDFFFANTPYIRDIIEESLRERGVSLHGLPYQICPVSELEKLCLLSRALDRELASLIAEKVDSPADALSGFADWAQQRWPNGAATNLPSHERTHEDYFLPMANRFRTRATEESPS